MSANTCKCGRAPKVIEVDAGHFVRCDACNLEGAFIKQRNCDKPGQSEDWAIACWNEGDIS